MPRAADEGAATPETTCYPGYAGEETAVRDKVLYTWWDGFRAGYDAGKLGELPEAPTQGEEHGPAARGYLVGYAEAACELVGGRYVVASTSGGYV